MTDIVVRDVDQATFRKLSRLASVGGLSVEEQVKRLLSEAVNARTVLPMKERRASAERVAAMTPKGVTQTNSTILIREDRDR